MSESVDDDGVITAVFTAFVYFKRMDEANAAVHCASVRYSPLTFRLYEALLEIWPADTDIGQEMMEIRPHVGLYEEDKGR